MSEPHSDELDTVRIRRLAFARRAAYRARSYCIIAAVACGVTAVQLAWNAIWRIRQIGVTSTSAAFILFALLLLNLATWFTRRALALHREAKRSALEEPPSPPDFSTLNDGSTRWKNLEDVR